RALEIEPPNSYIALIYNKQPCQTEPDECEYCDVYNEDQPDLIAATGRCASNLWNAMWHSDVTMADCKPTLQSMMVVLGKIIH
ncbi:MAG: hypothetical protein ACPLW9_00455, partial [Minisyncoccales bacterium]